MLKEKRGENLPHDHRATALYFFNSNLGFFASTAGPAAGLTPPAEEDGPAWSFPPWELDGLLDEDGCCCWLVESADPTWSISIFLFLFLVYVGRLWCSVGAVVWSGWSDGEFTRLTEISAEVCSFSVSCCLAESKVRVRGKEEGVKFHHFTAPMHF